MKIMFFIQDLGFGGVLRQVSLLAANLARRGHGVSVIAMYPKDDTWRGLWNADSIDIGTLFSRKPYRDIPGPITMLMAVSRLRRLLKRERTEVLYCFGGSAAMLVSWLAARTLPGTKLVWGIRGSGALLRLVSDNIKYKAVFQIPKYVSSSVPLVVSNSEAGLYVRQNMGYKFVKHLVIHNGIDTERFKPDTKARNELRRAWGVSEKEVLVGIVSRIIEAKGFRLFLEAASAITKERKNLWFVCVGEGDEDYKKRMVLLSKDLGIYDRVIWAGFREDMNAVFNALDVLCSASYGEGFPNVVGEAMACGVPCVVTDVGASAEIVGKLGVVVQPGDAKMLAGGLENILNMLPDFDSTDLRRRIAENFSVEKMVERTEQALKEVLSGG